MTTKKATGAVFVPAIHAFIAPVAQEVNHAVQAVKTAWTVLWTANIAPAGEVLYTGTATYHALDRKGNGRTVTVHTGLGLQAVRSPRGDVALYLKRYSRNLDKTEWGNPHRDPVLAFTFDNAGVNRLRRCAQAMLLLCEQAEKHLNGKDQ